MAERASAEQRIAVALRPILEGIASGGVLAEAPEIQSALSGLEYFLSQILAEVYPYWKGESFDGFYLSEAKKLGPGKAELRGVCILISDQAVTPFHLKIQASPSKDEIDWMECRLGKRGYGKGGIERTPWSSWRDHSYSLLQDSLKAMDWAYKVTFGEERHSG